MSRRPSSQPHRAHSAPPRSRRSRLEEVLAAGLASLSLQPADVDGRVSEGAKNKKLYDEINNRGVEPELQEAALSQLDPDELEQLLMEDEQQQQWEAERTMHLENEVLALPGLDDLKAHSAQRTAARKKAWYNTKRKQPPVPARMTRYGDGRNQSHIPYDKQAVLIKFFDETVHGNPKSVSDDEYNQLANSLDLAPKDVIMYMSKLYKARSRASIKAREAAEAGKGVVPEAGVPEAAVASGGVHAGM